MTASVLQEVFADDSFGSGTTVTSAAFTAFATPGSTIEVWITCSANVLPASIVDSASQSSYTFKGSVFDAAHGAQLLALYVLQNNASSAKLTVTTTWSGAQSGKGIWVKEIGGVASASYDNSSLLIKPTPGTGANAVAGTAITPASPPVLCSSIAMECFLGNGSDLAAGTGYSLGTSGWAYGSGTPLAKSESKRLTSATSTTPTYTAATNGATGIYLIGLAMYDEAAGGGTTVTPSAGTIAAAGSAASIGRSGTPTLGSLALAGIAPTVSVSGAVTIQPTAGAIASAGAAPVPVRGTVVVPSAGALTAAGLAPTPIVATTMQPGAVALVASGVPPQTNTGIATATAAAVLAGSAPTVSIGSKLTVTPGAGALGASGSAPLLGMGEAPASAILAIASSAPVVGTSGTPSVAALTLTGSAPIAVSGTVIAVPSGAIAATGAAPIDRTTEAPQAAAAALAGFAPTLIRGTALQPATGALSLGSNSPQQNAGLAPGAGALTTGGFAPTLNGLQIITPAAAQLAAAGVAPTTRLAITVTPIAGSIATSSSAPSVASGLSQTPSTGAVGFSGSAPVLGLQESPGSTALAIVGIAPTVIVAGAGQPPSGALSTSGFAPSIVQTTASLVVPGSAQLGAIGYAPSGSHSSTARGLAGLARGGDGSAAPFAEFYHAASEVLRYGIDWTYWLARLWPSAIQVAPGLAVRPTAPNGYQYVCAVGGVTQSIEPTWPAMPGASVLDGTVLWTSQPIDTTSLTAGVVSVEWTASGPLVLSGSSLLAPQLALVLIDASGAISGKDYDVLCTATMTNGPPLTGKLRIKVR